ncbi:hypothetical protein GO755_40480, partial [Spirosoma sp. HMF4905]|nr:hypothetical protein [Spirosoma arboris]
MDFKDQINQLADRVSRLKDSIQTEEATNFSVFRDCMKVTSKLDKLSR